jgi:hypothetical protein
MLKLAKSSLCPGEAPWWLDIQKNASAFAIAFSDNADGRMGGHPGVLLRRLESIADGACLSLRVHVDPARKPPVQYSVAIEGLIREDEAPWFARIDLDEQGRGRGLCSHALLHVHVGQDRNAKFQARAPLPWFTPWEALDWLLATADPGLEPCPHR